MTDPFAEHDKKAEAPASKPVEPPKKTDELAVDLAEEWNAPPDAGETTGN